MAWPLTGLILGAAMLTKGPPALVEFYLPLVVFLVWQRQWKLLVAPAHLVCLLLMAVPAGLWVWGLYAGNPAGFGATVHVWLHQMGVDRVANPSPDDGGVRRYLMFPLETITTFSPWIFFMIPAFVPLEQTPWHPRGPAKVSVHFCHRDISVLLGLAQRAAAAHDGDLLSDRLAGGDLHYGGVAATRDNSSGGFTCGAGNRGGGIDWPRRV